MKYVLNCFSKNTIVHSLMTLVLMSFIVSAQTAQAYASNPTLTLVSPSNYDEFASNDAITFSAVAYDEVDGDISHKIRWRSSINGTFDKGASVTANLSEGIHKITAVVKNSQSLVTRKRITVRVLASVANIDSNTQPNIEIDFPQNGSTFESDTVINFMGSASDNEDGNLSNDIHWYSNIDGSLGVGSDINSALSSGTHSIAATTTDSQGMSKTVSVNIVVQGEVVNTAPAIALGLPNSGSSYEYNSVIIFQASASDNEDGNLSNQIVWQSNVDGYLGTGSDISRVLSSGSHTVTAQVNDSNGLSASQSVNVQVLNEVVNTEPTVAINTPKTDSTFEFSSVINFSGSANDNEDGNLSSNIIWNSSIDGFIGQGANFTKVLSNGTHIISAFIEDSEGLAAVASVTTYVLEDTQNTQPNLEIDSPQSGASFDKDSMVNFMASASDPEDGNLSNSIQWSSNVDGILGVGSDISASLSTGTHVITATAVDSSNASIQRQVTILVTGEQSDNQAPTVTILSPSNGGSYDSQAVVTFSATASDNEDGNISSYVEWTSNVDGYLGTGASLSSTLSDGTHTIKAVIHDSETLSHSQEVTITVSNQPTGEGFATISWTAPTFNTDNTPLSNLTGFKVYYGTSVEQMTESVIVSDANATSVYIDGLTNNNTYYFAVTAFNSNGVESDMSNISSKSINY